MDIVRRKLILSPIGTYRAKRPSKCAVHLIESQIKEVKMKGRPNSYRCPFHRGIRYYRESRLYAIFLLLTLHFLGTVYSYVFVSFI